MAAAVVRGFFKGGRPLFLGAEGGRDRGAGSFCFSGGTFELGRRSPLPVADVPLLPPPSVAALLSLLFAAAAGVDVVVSVACRVAPLLTGADSSGSPLLLSVLPTFVKKLSIRFWLLIF